MESHLICEPHDNRHLINVLHTILNVPEEEPFIPSEYFNEMKMSAEERLESLCKNRKNRMLPEPIPFLATPDVIIFQNFTPGKWYNATLTLQNKEQYCRCVRVYFETSIHFRLLHPPKVIWTKVAPGMTYQLIVSFNGDEIKDYQHQITFITEEEEFTLPIFAFRPRPLIDFPDHIKMPDVPVHVLSEKNIILRNHSTVAGTFNIIATEPCSVCPSKANLAPNEKIFLKILFKTSTLGPERSAMIIRFDDDIKLKVIIECNATSSTIQLEKDFIRFEDTFIGLQRQTTLNLHFRGTSLGHFKWKMYQSAHAEKTRKLQLAEVFDQVREFETMRSMSLKWNNIIDEEGHATVYQRILMDEVEEIEESEEFLFKSSFFHIIPLTGDIGPTGNMEFTLIFSPIKCQDYEVWAYLDITGCEERLPLKLCGTGLGPSFKLYVAELHANNIFLCSEHEYEIIVANVGHIPGSVSFINKDLEFGGDLKCDPEILYVGPNQRAAFIVCFSPGEEGKFIEKIDFVVNESKEMISFVMTGNVIAPLLSLDVDEINFGVVAFGYRKTEQIRLINTSPVPIQYHVEIYADGHLPVIDHESFLNGLGNIPTNPKEFKFEPERGIVDAESTTVGSLTLLPNSTGVKQTDFIVHMWGEKDYRISVTINTDFSFNIFGKGPQLLCQVLCDGQGPAVSFLPPALNFGEVVLLNTVTKELEIINDTPIPANISFSFAKRGSFSLKDTNKYVCPDSTDVLPISVYLKDPGKVLQNLTAVVTNGQTKTVSLSAIGVGTSINCNPKLEPVLNLGVLITYKKFSFPLNLLNEGSKWHKLCFSRSDNLKTAKDAPNSSAGFSSCFKITPNYLHLFTNRSEIVHVVGSRKYDGCVSEHFYCHAIIEKSPLKNIIFSFDIIAKFIDPHVEVSKSKLNFRVDVTSDYVHASLRDDLKIRNESGLNLEIDLVIQPPFYIIMDDNAVGHVHLVLKNLSFRKIFVEFRPPPQPKKCKTFSENLIINYRDHPKVDTVPVIAVSNYPTLSITPQVVDFACVPLGSTTYQTVILRNVSPLPVIYKWLWSDDIIERKFEISMEGMSIIINDQDTLELKEECLIEEKIQHRLNSLLETLDENEEEKEFIQSLPERVSENKFSKIFSIVPHEGCLEPGEYNITYFQFKPQPNSEVIATVYCHILGGENEPVTLTGKSKKISFCLEESVIDLGRIYFYEIVENTAVIINNGEGKFSFSTSKASMKPGWLIVDPTVGSVATGDSALLSLKCFPGAVGRFETSFVVEIDYLDPATITVWGVGVYPQIYLPLPRPSLSEIDPYISYSAIAELGTELPPCRCRDDRYISSVDKMILESDDWVVISQTEEGFPCMMEMELSTERVGARFQLLKNDSLLTTLNAGETVWPIPNFVVAPYVFDLGTVKINTKTRYNVTYVNYGPDKTAVKTATTLTFNRYGFEAHFVKQIMEPNQVSELHFLFHPNTDKYPQLNTNVTEYLYLDIKNGPRIPLQLTALVATPTIEVSHSEIDFGSIRCGDCLRMTINLINNGFLASSWHASIQETLKSKSKLRSSFFLLCEEGSLEPGEKFYLRVYFEPQYDDFLSAKLLITVDGNYRENTVELKGVGMEPILEIVEETITFSPNIPFSTDNYKYVSIRNASKFPVEFYFFDFDSPPGADLPPVFQEFYDNLLVEMEDESLKKYPNGIIIESLESQFLRNVSVSFNCILKISKNINAVYFVIFVCTFDEYIQLEDEKEQKENDEILRKINEIMASVDDMDSEEFETMKNDYPEIHKSYIKDRKEQVILRKEIRKLRKIQREMEKVKKKDGFTHRALLQPGEMLKYKISFLSKVCGQFKHSFEIGVIGWPVKFSIKCNAISDIPRISMDPHFLFEKVVESRSDKNKYEQCVFLEEADMFDFGGILLPSPLTNNSFETKTTFYMNNVSYITCDINFSMQSDCEAFLFQSDSCIIEPTNRTELIAVAAPLKQQIYDDFLIISIKNNPKVERIKLSCHGCEVGVDVNPKYVFFERVILNTSVTKEIVITNSCPVTVNWYFVNCKTVSKNLKIDRFNGTIMPFSYETVYLEFTANDAEAYFASFQVEVYDELNRLIYFSEIAVSSETTVIDFVYDEDIDLGVIKGGKSYKFPFGILNRGKYEVLCQFSVITEENREAEIQRKCFQINPLESKVQSAVKYETTITFTPIKAMTLVKLPIFKCSLMDPFRQLLLKTFDITISAKVFLSKFEICPYPDIYFGYQTVGSEKMHTKKPKPTTLKSGIFSLTSSTGIIDPDEAVTITIKSKPKEVKEYEETVVIFASEPSYIDRKGKPLTIHVIACEPKVSFDDLTNVFKEQYLMDKMDDSLISTIDAHTIFVKSEKKLIFNKVCVNTTETTKIRIQNVGHVAASITARFIDSSYIFTVTPHSLMIDPYQTGFVMIAYTPDSLDQHRETLVLSCDGLSTANKLSIDIIGEPCAPEIALLEPIFEDMSYNICYFPPTLVGSTAFKDIVFKNVGVIPCKAIIEVCNDDWDQLCLIPKDETISRLNFWEGSETMKHTNLVNLSCGQEAAFVLKFEPSKTTTIEVKVKIHTVNNPFETKTIYVLCNAYYIDVILEGLQTYIRSASLGSVTTGPVLGYGLHFGYVCLHTLNKRCFTIKNNSDVYTYKFEFPAFSEVIFTPAVGHLQPKSTKQILAVFLSKNPVVLNETRINCAVCKIEYEEPQPGFLSWDDRQHMVVWCPETVQDVKNYETKGDSGTSQIVDENAINLKKIEENPEPPFTMIEGSWQNIAIFLTIIADYATYSCDLCELLVPDTFLMSKQAINFEVENPGKVVLKLSWSIVMHDLPKRINSSRSVEDLCSNKNSSSQTSKRQPTPLRGDEHFLYCAPGPLQRSSSSSTLFSSEILESSRSADSWNEFHCLPFTITPEKANIAPEAKETFTLTFAPVDVYDYLIQLKATIENKSPLMKDLEIKVKARSILPLYCFELEPTNYISEKRKGKKLCKDLFDDNSKVVEFESVGLGVICTRKFYLKNPTKNAYFFEWQPALKIDPHLSCYHCHTSSGVVAKGKTVEMVFSFIPQDCGVFEEFFFFSIPVHKIRVTFLMAGIAREPKVFFDQVHIDLPSTVIGMDITKDVLINNAEMETYGFKFGKLPMLSEGLSIQPSRGFVKAKEAVPIKIVYNPTKKGLANFDLKCLVDKIKTPLDLSISCNCYEIQAVASYIEQNGREVQLVTNKVNILNLGGMVPHQRYKIPFTIVNIGKIGFQWFWCMNINKIAGFFDIEVDLNEEILPPNETSRTKMTIEPLIKCKMKPHKIYLKVKSSIPHGPTYSLQLSGSAERPPYKFSFLEYDFGSCIVQKTPSKFYKTSLKFSNFNIWPLT
ncbi:hydrocephalus-inducing protein -like protein [Asbolus verrucosus]|uniref:Hydrocephalus-inducing protein-like protein n=1 Tax=Asbolus verrucosus TaxID=1661398 RepID=A0A482WCZ5_ASBVE|nr:hydrocephalus-inducing protein -like protein [Asbolus verrucosus]